MLMPKKVKYRKHHRGRRKGMAKGGGKMWIRVSPDKSVTKKPLETRMGKGKGPPEEWVAVVKPGRIMYELEGVTQEGAAEAVALAAHKLPMKPRCLARDQAVH